MMSLLTVMCSFPLQDGVISKPFRISELIPKIEELVLKYNMVPRPC